MRLATFVIFATLATVLVLQISAADNEARKCISSQCKTNCCLRGKCADSPKWCPCSKTQNPCKRGQRCVLQTVQCFRAPCYPVANCV